MSMARRTSIAIIGGGIGGLTAAAALLHAGFDAHVYEQAKALGEVGAGINIGPNASRILHRLGIGEVLGRTGVKPASALSMSAASAITTMRSRSSCLLVRRSPLLFTILNTFQLMSELRLFG
jgi:2-polyprenyl-6-methoxyphenol hydroxylase-like FAD-dependent oxidoreductase